VPTIFQQKNVGTAQARLCPPYEFPPEAAFILEKQRHCCANGSRECAPDDRLREAIQNLQRSELDCFVAYAPRNDD